MSDRLVSADKAKEVLKHLLYETAMNNDLDIADIYEDIAEKRLDTWIELIPTANVEPTEEQVKEYCRKRCLVIVTSELFNEMKARWSAEPVIRCKDCKWQITAYCPMPSWERKDNHYCYKGEREEDAEIN